MSNYPTSLDDDTTLPAINDNLTEIGGDAINSLRDAVFNIEQYVGTNPFGVSIESRLGLIVSQNGTINSSVITSLGLVTLPVTNNQIADNAGIPESKLHLDYRTQDLFNYIRDLSKDVNLALGWISVSGSKLEPHLIGAIYRHDMAQIDVAETSVQFLNNVFRVQRDNTDSYTLVNDMNNELLAHQWADGSPFGIIRNITTNDGSVYPSNYGHTASGIFVVTSRFQTIPQTADDVQAALEFIDQSSILLLGTRIQNLYANGISENSRSSSLQADGYGQPIVSVTPATAFLLFPDGLASSPVDDISHGDDIIQFNPTNGYNFDAQFALVQPGDIIRINYGTVEVAFVIEGKKYMPGTGGGPSQYFVRIAGRNLFNSTNALARIDRPLFNNNKYGVLALAPVNNPNGNPSSLIVGNPRGAQVLGIGFNPDQIDNSHYLLYLILYPTGSPTDGYNILPGIDVTGNQGSTPGVYTLDSLVSTTNASFRKAGYNYRFIAFQNQGQFGIMLADPYGGAAFSIVNANVVQSGANAGQYDPIATGVNFPNNVVSALPTNLLGSFNVSNGSMAVTASVSQTGFLFTGSVVIFASQPGTQYTVTTVSGTAITLTGNYSGTSNVATTAALANASVSDPLGFGFSGANIASPPFMSNYSDVNAAQLPTKIFVPLRRNNYYVNGVEKEDLNLQVGQALDTFGDGYWVATIDGYTNFPGVRTQVSYNIPLFLSTSDLKVGKTLVVQPLGGNSSLTNFGRFIITNIQYEDGPPVSTIITVYDAVHATGSSPAPILPVGSQVAIYFNSDSVAFDAENVSDFNNYVPTTVNFKRYFEVYIDDLANTYTHERARLSLSGTVTINNVPLYGSTSLATTSNAGINIVNVSPKLRGFSVSGLTKINLQVLSFDQATGVFTGYLCSFDGATTSNLGPLTFGQKGQVTRFYDYTNIDFIDIIFDSSIPSTAFPAEITSPTNIDIQLFPTLSLDEEIMLLGSCQFNDANGLITYQEDERQFGNVSEEQLSTSAINFIEAPTRELHENGIIRGFDILGYTTGTVTFSGGTALVNGKIVQINPQTVTIPAVMEVLPITIGGQPTITSKVDTITWFICINDEGEIELIASTDFDPLGPFVTQYAAAALNHLRIFYVMNPNAVSPVPYQIRGSFLANLVLTQRDVTPIATVATTVTNPGGGFTVSSILVADARRYVTNGYGGLAEPLTLGDAASFRSFESLSNWLIQFNNLFSASFGQSNQVSNKVIVKGHVDIIIPIFLEYIYGQVYFEGDNGSFDVFIPTAFELGSNVHFNNITFNYFYDPVVYDSVYGDVTSGRYNPTNPGNNAPADLINASRTDLAVGKGLIHIGMGEAPFNTVVENISITNCNFKWYPLIAGSGGLPPFVPVAPISSTAINRFSFILVEYGQAAAFAPPVILQNIDISNNTFTDNVLSSFVLANYETVRSVIAFVCLSNITSESKLINATIRNNICNKDQMIAIVPASIATSNTVTTAIDTTSCIIEENTCGAISIFTQYTYPIDVNYTSNYFNFTLDKNNGLTISKNVCKYITSTDARGIELVVTSGPTNSILVNTGPMTISDNVVSWIKLPLNVVIPGATPCIIKNNKLNGYDTNFRKNYLNNFNNFLTNAAIELITIGSSFGVNSITIDGNWISDGFYTTFVPPVTNPQYDFGIFTQHDADICNNLIIGLGTTLNTSINPTGIVLNGSVSLPLIHSNIHHNKLYRETVNWTAYIDLGMNGSHQVANNTFDNITPDGIFFHAAQQIIATGGTINSSSISDNVNQAIFEAISFADDKTTYTAGPNSLGSTGFLGYQLARVAGFPGTLPTNVPGVLFADGYTGVAAFKITDVFSLSSNYVGVLEIGGNGTNIFPTGVRNLGFTIPLTDRLPNGVKIIGISVGVWVSYSGSAQFDISTSIGGANASANNEFSLSLTSTRSNISSGSASTPVTDVKNNITPFYNPASGINSVNNPTFATDNSVLNSTYETLIFGSGGTTPVAPSSGSNYICVSPSTANANTQFINVTSPGGFQYTTGNGYRISAQFNMNWLRVGGTANTDTLQIYISPLLITYQW